MTWEALQQKQPNIVKMLTNSIKKARFSHAYLFEGNKGTGKKQAAFLLAKSYFCKQKDHTEPCGICTDCKRIDSGNHPDVHFIAPEGLSIKKDQVTNLVKEFSYRGVESKRKMYIVEHADKMTAQAANSLLKFLEEPGDMTIAVLLTEQGQQILTTVVSRCQVLSFAVLSPADVEQQLASEKASLPLKKLAAALTQDVTEAEALCENERFAQARNIVIQLVEELQQRPYEVYLLLQDKWFAHFQEKEELERGLDFILLWYRDLLLVQLQQADKVVYIDRQQQLKQQGLRTSQKRITRHMDAVLHARRRLDANVNPQFVMEQLLFRLQEG